MSSSIQVLTAETFDQEIAAAGVVCLVDFWADWCGPCHAQLPVLQALAADHAGSLVVASIDVQEYPAVAERFEVVSLPTLIFFVGGEPVRRLSGVRRRPQLERELASLAG